MKTLPVKRKAEIKMVLNLHPVALTAAVCLRNSLISERYEECPEMVSIAREFGADYWFLHRILTDFHHFRFPGEKDK